MAELLETRQVLLDAGTGSRSPQSRGSNGGVYDHESRSMSKTSVMPDVALDDVDVRGFDALVLPGGFVSPDTLRTTANALA